MMRQARWLAAMGLMVAVFSAPSSADSVAPRGTTISGTDLQAILVAMPEITNAHIDLARYDIRVVATGGYTEVQLFPRVIGPADPTLAGSFGSAKPELTTVLLTSDDKRIAKAIYCCR